MAITLNGKHKIQTRVKTDREIGRTITFETFTKLHTDFIREKQLENLSDRTIADHKMLFGYFVKWSQSTHWFSDNQGIQKSLFLDYKEYMLYEKKYASCTVNVRLRPIKAYITWLFNNRHIDTNYNHFIKLVKVSDDRMKPLSKTEVQQLIEAIGDSTYARFRDLSLSMLILDCGIRTTEALTLTVHDINFQESYVIVQASKSKTRTERVLPISRQTLNYLKHLKDIANEYTQEHIFLSTTGNNAITKDDILHNFRRYKKEAGITKKCTPYVLRHTFATQMVKRGVDIFTLQRLMGHNNITTTRQYVFLDNTDIISRHRESNILKSFFD